MSPKRPNMPVNPASVRAALLSDEPLMSLAAVIDGDTPAGKVFCWVQACLLETNSAGLTIVFERFSLEEIAEMETALEAVGATETLADLRALRKAFELSIGSGMDELDASEELDCHPSDGRSPASTSFMAQSWSGTCSHSAKSMRMHSDSGRIACLISP